MGNQHGLPEAQSSAAGGDVLAGVAALGGDDVTGKLSFYTGAIVNDIN